LSSDTPYPFQLHMSEPVMTVDDVLTLKGGGFGRFQWILWTVTGFAWSFHCLDVFSVQYLSTALGPIFNLTKLEKSLIAVTTFSGWAVGAYVWGVLADKYGRRRLLLLSCLLVVLFCALTAVCSFTYELLV